MTEGQGSNASRSLAGGTPRRGPFVPREAPDREPPESESLRAAKAALRSELRGQRRALGDRGDRSRQIAETMLRLPEWGAAHVVMLYVSTPEEVETRLLFEAAWRLGKGTIVPYCSGADLRLYRLASFDELAPGALGILEPRKELRDRAEVAVAAGAIDLVVLPGLGFDRAGGRIGQGRGYYDRFVPLLRDATPCCGIAFECQMRDAIPMGTHDRRVDLVVTETAVYRAAPVRR